MGKSTVNVFLVSIAGLLMAVALFIAVLTNRVNTQRLNKLTSEIVEAKEKSRLYTHYDAKLFRLNTEKSVEFFDRNGHLLVNPDVTISVCNGFDQCTVVYEAPAGSAAVGIIAERPDFSK